MEWIASHFLNPAFIAGGAALVASPVIIHLLNRLRFKRVRFAAMEFLLQSQKRNRRRVLIEQLLLLLLRILIVLFLVALISRLVLDPNEMSLFQGARAHHVVVIDDSGSMQDLNGESTAFNAAKETIKKLVAEGARRPGTQKFTLILLSESDQPVFTQREVDDQFQVELDTKLKNLKPSHQSLDLLAGLEGANNVLAEDQAVIRHLHVISDFRLSNWENQKSVADMVNKLDEAGVTVNFVKTVAARNQNLAVTSLTGDTQVASAGVPVRFRVSVKNCGDQVVDKVSLSVLQDGQRLPMTVNLDKIESGVEFTQEFDLTFDRPGRHRIDLALPADSLTMDNARFLALAVAPINKILIIEGNAQNDEGDYLADALAANSAVTGFSVEQRSPDFLRQQSLESYQSIFMLNVSELPADGLAPLKEFVRKGGGLCWFLGDEINAQYYNKELHRDGQGLFPAKLGITSFEMPELTEGNEGEADSVFTDHPILQVLTGADNPLPGYVRVSEYFAVADDWKRDDQEREDNVKTIATLVNKDPLVFTSQYGAGSVVTFMTTAGPRWNNWAEQVAYVPLMLDTAKFVSRRDQVLETRIVGEPIQLSLNPVEYLDEVEFISPESSGNPPVRAKASPNKQNKTATNQPDDAADETKSDENKDDAKSDPKPDDKADSKNDPATTDDKNKPLRLESTFRDTDYPGVYIVKMQAQDLVAVERWITFNVPNDESELELATTEQIRKQLDNNLSVEIQEPGQFSWIEGKDAGQEVRQWILILLIGFLLAEQFMGYRLSFHTRGGAA
jgi:uncharacterized membrane protein